MGGPPGWTACGEVGSGRFPGDEAGFRARVADAAAAAVCLLVASAPLRCGSRSAGKRCAYGASDGGEDFRHGEGRRQLQGNASHALSDESGDLEQKQAECVELPPAEGGGHAHDNTPKRIEQTVRNGMQKQSEGVGNVGGVGEP